MRLAFGTQWVSLGFRFRKDTLMYNRLFLGLAACLGWIRFMRTSFIYSPRLGPKFRMIQRMLSGDVAQWLALYLCFFAACQALLLGVMLGDRTNERGGVRTTSEVHNGSETLTVLYVAKMLFELTVNPTTEVLEEAVGGWPGEWDVSPDLIGWLELGFTWACMLFWTMLGNIVLLNLLIAMMGNTYVEVLQKAESEWRLSFCQMVLFQEATPRVFVPPFRAFDTRNRPPHHVRGTLDVLNSTGAKVKVECWFLHVELSVTSGETDSREMSEWHEKQRLAAQKHYGEADLTDAPLEVKIAAELDRRLGPIAARLEEAFGGGGGGGADAAQLTPHGVHGAGGSGVGGSGVGGGIRPIRSSAPDAFGVSVEPSPRLAAMTNALIARASGRASRGAAAPPVRRGASQDQVLPRPDIARGESLDSVSSVGSLGSVGSSYEPTQDDEAAVCILNGAAALLSRRMSVAARRRSHQGGSWVLEPNHLLA